MPAQVQQTSGFEALLKPLQDVCCKNWEVTLAQYLELYLVHLRIHEDPEMNFSQAALLLQNSTSFYSKRVDLVFSFMTKLIDTLQKCKVTDDSGEDVEDGGPARKKRTRVLRMEGLEVLGSVFSDHNINMKWEKQKKFVREKQSIVLNTSMKVPCKPDTSYLIYVTPEVDMGYKEEYRLNWRISSDGVLHEDFNNDGQSNNLVRLRENPQGDLSISTIGYDDGIGEVMDTCQDMEFEPPPIEPDIAPDPELIFIPDDMPDVENDQNINNCPANELDVKKIEDRWTPISLFNFNFNLLKFNKKRVFKLPKSILNCAKKRKRNEADKNSLLSDDDTYLCHSSLIGKKGPLGPTAYKVREERNLKNLIILRRRLGTQYVKRAEKAYNGDFLGFAPRPEDEAQSDGESDDGDHLDNGGQDNDDDYNNEPIPELDLGNVEVQLPLETREEREDPPGETYERDALLTMQRYKESKRENASMATKVAQRVAAWHESLHPILVAAEKRSEFDIQRYGTQILNKFSEKEEEPVLSFKEITEGQPKEEICRYFLSTLVLANTYNLEIRKTQDGDLVKDCLEVKLLSKVRHHDELDGNLREATKDCGY